MNLDESEATVQLTLVPSGHTILIQHRINTDSMLFEPCLSAGPACIVLCKHALRSFPFGAILFFVFLSIWSDLSLCWWGVCFGLNHS